MKHIYIYIFFFSFEAVIEMAEARVEVVCEKKQRRLDTEQGTENTATCT
jgi:hypothetical protein